VYTRNSKNNSTYGRLIRYVRTAVVIMFKEPIRDATIEQYMSVTLATVGPSILGAGVCEVLAFAVGKCFVSIPYTTVIVHDLSACTMFYVDRAA
jgi:hypothetical protein